jgi:shikimate dehydrogenase
MQSPLFRPGLAVSTALAVQGRPPALEFHIRDRTALLVGPGGAGRAVAFALCDLGAGTLLVHDQDVGRAARLTCDLESRYGAGRGRAVADPGAALADAAGVVNATPVGMLGMPGVPMPAEGIEPGHWVADIIYTPLETELVRIAGARGCKVMGGAGMCVHQAARNWQLFSGLAPDLDRMRRAFDAAAALRDGDVAEVV